jgi:hypothetical protein
VPHSEYSSKPYTAYPSAPYTHQQRQQVAPQEQQQQQQHRRPTLSDLSEEEAVTVNTPEQLLEFCCQFPACYDPLYELCIDTCRLV